jgi:hypothetical protein
MTAAGFCPARSLKSGKAGSPQTVDVSIEPGRNRVARSLTTNAVALGAASTGPAIERTFAW